MKHCYRVQFTFNKSHNSFDLKVKYIVELQSLFIRISKIRNLFG